MAENPLYQPARPLLQARGFKKKGGVQVYTKELSPGVNAWLGLNAGTGPGRLSLNPQVGVRHEQVARWIALLRDKDPEKSTAPTVKITMLRLLPEPRPVDPWALVAGEEEHNAATWERFRRHFDDYAIPWLVERATPEQLVEPLRRKEGADTSRLSLPVLLWILGDEDGAREAIEQGRQFEFRGGLVIDYEAYAKRLIAEIDAHPGGPPA